MKSTLSVALSASLAIFLPTITGAATVLGTADLTTSTVHCGCDSQGNTINLSGTLVPIPEPSTAVLAFSGLLMLARHRR